MICSLNFLKSRMYPLKSQRKITLYSVALVLAFEN